MQTFPTSSLCLGNSMPMGRTGECQSLAQTVTLEPLRDCFELRVRLPWREKRLFSPDSQVCISSFRGTFLMAHASCSFSPQGVCCCHWVCSVLMQLCLRWVAGTFGMAARTQASCCVDCGGSGFLLACLMGTIEP